MRPVLQNGCQVAALRRTELLLFSTFVFWTIFERKPRKILHVTVHRPHPLVASGAGGAPSLGPTAPASPSPRPATAATTPALAALSPRPHRPHLASPRGASERRVRPSKEFWSLEPAQRRKLVDEGRAGAGWGGRGAVVLGTRGGACTGTRRGKVRVEAPHARLKVAATRATGEGHGERPCGSLRGTNRANSEGKHSEKLEQKSSRWPYTRPVALWSTRLRLKSPEEILGEGEGRAVARSRLFCSFVDTRHDRATRCESPFQTATSHFTSMKLTDDLFLLLLNPVSAFGTGGSEGPHMIGREDTGTLLTNHMRAFRPSISKAETGFKNGRPPVTEPDRRSQFGRSSFTRHP